METTLVISRNATCAVAVLFGVVWASQSHIACEQKRKLLYPLTCAGIRVGHSNDSFVDRLYGKGLFVENEGHVGGRYFVDPSHRLMLHVEIGVDRFIDLVELSLDLDSPRKLSARELKTASTSRLRATTQPGGGLRFGMSSRALIKKFGRPSRNKLKGAVRVIEYHTDYESTKDVLEYEAVFKFKSDRLTSISIYNGE